MGERNVIKAALLGAGTVGSGVYALSEMLRMRCSRRQVPAWKSRKFLCGT